MTKYNNIKIIVDGIKFVSKAEADYYLYLKQMVEEGVVSTFSCQPKFTLIPSYEKYGKKVRPSTYTPDFYVKYANGNEEYIDVKGMGTQAGELRRKLFDYLYPELTLKWVAKSFKYGNEYGWIDYDELNKIRAKNRKLKKGNN